MLKPEFFFWVFILLFSPASISQSELKIAAIAQNSDTRLAFHTLAKDFEAENPTVKIKFIMKEDVIFKVELDDMLSTSGAVDIVSWHSGDRLYKYVKRDLVLDISDMWSQRNLDEDFSSIMKGMVSFQNKTYAVPYSYYQWGFYYRKSLFNRLGIAPPSNWQSMMDSFSTLQKNNITPIYIGTKNPWPVGIWFEYLNVRLNGLEFHKRFILGNIPSNSPNIVNVLSHWKQLIDSGYFKSEHEDKILAEGLPYIFRDKVGVILAGNFIETFLPEKIRNDIAFFPFPTMDESLPVTQVSPIDIMFIAKNSDQKELAIKFLSFISEAKVQSKLNGNLFQFPINRNADFTGSELLMTVKKSLSAADSLTHFYDREVEEQYGLENMAIWKDFLANPNVDATINKMETTRLNYVNRLGSH